MAIPMRKKLLESFENLPPERQKELLDFAEFLKGKAKMTPSKKKKDAFKKLEKLEGILKDYCQDMSSVELQHKIGEFLEKKYVSHR